MRSLRRVGTWVVLVLVGLYALGRLGQPPSDPAGAGVPAGTAASSTSATTAVAWGGATGPLLAVVGVTDGDTLRVRVGGTVERVRVIGINAPELHPLECYGQEAASRMQSLVQSRSVRLVADPTQADRDRYGRLLRHVVLADGRRVADLLVAGGFAREYTYDRPYLDKAALVTAQASARAAGRGMWSAACRRVPLVQPSASATPTTRATATAACLLKGNINAEGERIYHVPGGRYYDVTRISPDKGERWFCSEAEAVAAGWRRSDE